MQAILIVKVDVQGFVRGLALVHAKDAALVVQVLVLVVQVLVQAHALVALVHVVVHALGVVAVLDVVVVVDGSANGMETLVLVIVRLTDVHSQELNYGIIKR